MTEANQIPPADEGPVGWPVGLPREEWRPVPGFESSYAVSDAGRVLSLERRCDSGGKTRRVRQRLLRPTLQMQRGKPSAFIVKLSRPNESSQYCTVARLVLMAFVGPPEDGQVAHYKDGDCKNGSLPNVEWSNFSAICIQAGCKPPGRNRRPNA